MVSITNHRQSADFAGEYQGTAKPPLTRVKLRRHGQRPLVFAGLLMLEAEATEQGFQAIRVWETSTGFVTQIEIGSEDADSTLSFVNEADTPEQVAGILNSFDPSMSLTNAAAGVLRAGSDTVEAERSKLAASMGGLAKQQGALLGALLSVNNL